LQPSVTGPAVSSTPLGVNWTPIFQGLALGVAQSMGATLTFPSTPSTPVTTQAGTTPQAQAPAEVQDSPSANLAPLETRLNNLESKFSSLESTINTLAQTQDNTNSQITSLASSVKTMVKGQENLTNTVSSLTKTFEAFIKASTPSNGNPAPNGAPSSNGSSTPNTPAAPANPSKSSPTAFSLEEITILKEDNANRKFQDLIVTADLESLVNKEGRNSVYMAAWYNGKSFKVYDITNYNMDSNKMLSDFWFDLINMNQGKFAYFHNWAGYDSILSLTALVNLPNFQFKPVINDGQVISVKIEFNNKLQLTIIDSIKVLPSPVPYGCKVPRVLILPKFPRLQGATFGNRASKRLEG